MNELKMFGMPIQFCEESQKLVPANDNIHYEDYSRKYSKGMFGLLADATYNIEDNPYYDFYKAIVEDDTKGIFQSTDLRYDSTVIIEGTAGGEFKKTAGHFHMPIPGQAVSYPELYQVIKGTALFVMQKVDDYRKEDGSMQVQDVILTKVEAGESVVIPPDYGHCTINIGAETMVFVNLVSCHSTNYYDSVKRHAGMCCYAFRTPDGGFRIEKNPRYDFACEPRLTTPTDSPVCGLEKNVPVYRSFLQDPKKYAYLNDPAPAVEAMFSLLKTL